MSENKYYTRLRIVGTMDTKEDNINNDYVNNGDDILTNNPEFAYAVIFKPMKYWKEKLDKTCVKKEDAESKQYSYTYTYEEESECIKKIKTIDEIKTRVEIIPFNTYIEVDIENGKRAQFSPHLLIDLWDAYCYMTADKYYNGSESITNIMRSMITFRKQESDIVIIYH